MGRMKALMVELEEEFFENAQEVVDTGKSFDECLEEITMLLPDEIDNWYSNRDLEELVVSLFNEK